MNGRVRPRPRVWMATVDSSQRPSVGRSRQNCPRPGRRRRAAHPDHPDRDHRQRAAVLGRRRRTRPVAWRRAQAVAATPAPARLGITAAEAAAKVEHARCHEEEVVVLARGERGRRTRCTPVVRDRAARPGRAAGTAGRQAHVRACLPRAVGLDLPSTWRLSTVHRDDADWARSPSCSTGPPNDGGLRRSQRSDSRELSRRNASTRTSCLGSVQQRRPSGSSTPIATAPRRPQQGQQRATPLDARAVRPRQRAASGSAIGSSAPRRSSATGDEHARRRRARVTNHVVPKRQPRRSDVLGLQQQVEAVAPMKNSWAAAPVAPSTAAGRGGRARPAHPHGARRRRPGVGLPRMPWSSDGGGSAQRAAATASGSRRSR